MLVGYWYTDQRLGEMFKAVVQHDPNMACESNVL